MKNISPYNNKRTVFHVSTLPALSPHSFFFKFNVGVHNNEPSLKIVATLNVNPDGDKQIDIATYESHYLITGEGLILEEHLHACCQQSIYAMQIFARLDEIGRSIPQEIFQCPGTEGFGDDLVVLAKAMNAIDGKRGFPPYPQQK